MIHLRFNNNAIFFIMEVKFNIYRVNFIFTIYNKMPIKNNLSNVFKLPCKSIYSVYWRELF